MKNTDPCIVINVVEAYGESFGGIFVVINQTLLKLNNYKILVLYGLVKTEKNKENLFKFSCKKLIEILQNQKYKKVIHIHGLWYLNSFNAAVIANYKKIPIIFSPHGMLELNSLAKNKLIKKIWLIIFGNYVLKNSKYIVVATKNEFKNSPDLNIYGDKIINIPLGGDHWITP